MKLNIKILFLIFIVINSIISLKNRSRSHLRSRLRNKQLFDAVNEESSTNNNNQENKEGSLFEKEENNEEKPVPGDVNLPVNLIQKKWK